MCIGAILTPFTHFHIHHSRNRTSAKHLCREKKSVCIQCDHNVKARWSISNVARRRNTAEIRADHSSNVPSWIIVLAKRDSAVPRIQLCLAPSLSKHKKRVLLAMITCGKIALKPKSVHTDAKSVIRDLWVFKDARTADRQKVPRHSQKTFIHVDQNIFWRDAVGPLVKRIGLACKLQNKNCFKSRPRKRGAKKEPKQGAYLSELWELQIGVPKLFLKLGTKPTNSTPSPATYGLAKRLWQVRCLFRKRFKYVRWDGGSPWKGKHRRFSTASRRPSGTKRKAVLWSRHCIMKPQVGLCSTELSTVPK